MNFNQHLELKDKHAILSPSYYHWLNYNDEKLQARYISVSAARRGTDLHALAHEAIRLGIKISARSNKTIANYVNDAINYKMVCEQPLYFSNNCFGTADAISFRQGKLRIHDLKTGLTPTSFKQLYIYAALFCLEYEVDPARISIELRIYQSNEVLFENADSEMVFDIMDKIVYFDQKLNELMKGAIW